MRSCASPSSSARARASSAETTSASRTTSFASSGSRPPRVLVHQPREQILVEAAPVDADAHRLAVAAGDLDHLGELRVALAAAADVAGVDAVLCQRFGAGRVRPQQLVAVEMEVADDRHGDARAARAVATMRGTAAAASSVLTVTRTSSEPACASARTCCAVDSTSAVSVLVIDCTTIGAVAADR